MLRELSGQPHQVTSGVAIRHAGGVVSFYVTSTVHFRALSDEEIQRYVASGEPMDKAGAYGIQGLGAGLITQVEGSHTAVVGLPLDETLQALLKLGVKPQ
jgi:septum formation protein